MANEALIVIDYTYDFVATDGKLTCGELGQAIEGKIVSLIDEFVAANKVVLFANDMHIENDPYHPESKLFPPHNIEGTAGRELYGAVKDVYEKYKSQVISFDKTRYSAFAGTNFIRNFVPGRKMISFFWIKSPWKAGLPEENVRIFVMNTLERF